MVQAWSAQGPGKETLTRRPGSRGPLGRYLGCRFPVLSGPVAGRGLSRRSSENTGGAVRTMAIPPRAGAQNAAVYPLASG